MRSNRRSTPKSLTRRNRSTRVRNNKRTGRPSLREAFHSANQRAKQRANRRLGKREGLTSVRAAIADPGDDGMIQLTMPQRMWRWLLALALIPLCAVTTIALFNVNDAGQAGSNFWADLLRTRHFLFFSVGMILMAGWFFTGLLERLFLYFYVLGHELTHAFFVYACGGRVSSISVSADGGYIMTNKSNILISLSPYFIPFWSVIILAVSSLIGLFTNIPYQSEALYLLIGGSWSFHLLWTLWMIPRDQPDLKENGVIFSLVVIYLANVIVLSVLLCLAPGHLTWHHWVNQFLDAWHFIQAFITRL